MNTTFWRRPWAVAVMLFIAGGATHPSFDAEPGTPAGLGYPVRAIREGDLFYIHRFTPDHWPCGNPELGLKDTDAGSTKAFISELCENDRFWQMSFGKRPPIVLFDLAKDPDCINNLANEESYATKVTALRETLFADLKKPDDPRVLGKGDAIDHYDSPRAKAAAQQNTKKAK